MPENFIGPAPKTVYAAHTTVEAALAAPTGSAASELQELLITWRGSEKEFAQAILVGVHPVILRQLSDAVESALHRIRKFVDREPWAELARSEPPNSEVSDAKRSDQ